ncbi:MAG TPA: acetyltransferase [Cyanobacteria bacterium UBA8803]|nr:acetyltransferase [Cyanobacteria bacterium UBA8803]
MLLKDKESGSLVKILELEDLLSPTKNTVSGKIQDGQEEQDPASFQKENLIFPSGENLPYCWLDADYRLKSEPS